MPPPDSTQSLYRSESTGFMPVSNAGTLTGNLASAADALPLPVAGAPAHDHPRAHSAAKRVLVLFGNDWDDEILHRYQATHEFFTEGFDLFSFPSNAQLMWFDIERFVDKLERKYSGRIDAVVSTNEQFGALAAALLAERLGLPGTKTETILLCQHKLAARDALRDKLPHLLPDWYAAVPYGITHADAKSLPYPLYVKPLKATFSVLARQVGDARELCSHLSFRPWEKHIIKRLLVPYNQVLKRRGNYAVDSHNVVLETPLKGLQINVDGYACGGTMSVLGMSDEVMYPNPNNGAYSFMRFEYPSRYAAPWRSKVEATTLEVMRAYGFEHGFFNLEFFLNPETGDLKLIEVNPRMAAQLAEFYRWCEGIDVYELAFTMACGGDVHLPANTPRFGAAASFVWRSFDGSSCPRLPTPDDMAWLEREYPEARLKCYPKSGDSLKRDIKWLGSHRWATLNMPSRDSNTLRADYERICARLQWPAPY
jgi:hypothetical protein